MCLSLGALLSANVMCKTRALQSDVVTSPAA